MWSSSDDDSIPECDYYSDDRGLCEKQPHLDDGTCFSLTLKAGFKVVMVRNFSSTCFFLIEQDHIFLLNLSVPHVSS